MYPLKKLLFVGLSLLLLSCSIAPDGTSKSPYYPVFEVFLNSDISEDSFKCNMKAGPGVTKVEGGNNFPSISWKDSPSTEEEVVNTFFIGIFSDETYDWCKNATLSNNTQFRCTHAIVAVDAFDVVLDQEEVSSGKVEESYLVFGGSYYKYSSSSWETGNIREVDGTKITEYTGPCKSGNNTYKIVLIASTGGVGKILGKVSNTPSYEYFIGKGNEISPIDGIVGIAEIDVDYKIVD